MNKKKRKGRFIMLLGVLFVLASLALTLYNSYTENRAADLSLQVLSALDMAEVQPQSELPDYVVNPDMQMRRKQIDGKYYVGTLSVPALNIKLPVMEEWSYENFKISPCVYEGTPYKDNFIVAAHNYRKHFGSLKNLQKGDKVTFKDMDGNVFNYEVLYTELLDNNDVEGMSSGEWDMSLFTCTYGGAQRVTVRLEKAK